MDRLRYHPVDLAECRLDALAVDRSQVAHRSAVGAGRVFLSDRRKINVARFIEDVFGEILIVGFVAIDSCSLRQVELSGCELGPCRCGCQA